MAKACGIKEDQPSAKSTGSEFAHLPPSLALGRHSSQAQEWESFPGEK